MKTPTFIETYHNVFPENFCEFLISHFEKELSDGFTYNRQQSEGVDKLQKEDEAISISAYSNMPDFEGRRPHILIWDCLQRCYEDYIEKYSSLKQGNVTANKIKMQRVGEGGGYHIWHAEQGGAGDQATRCLVYMVYLNTLTPEQNGETEFLYQQIKLAPVENTAVFWPAAFTHPHRGNPVYNDGVKYILTGWFHCDGE
jgi:hypothetical protein